MKAASPASGTAAASEGDQVAEVPSSEEIKGIVAHLAEDRSAGNPLKTWKELAADDIAASVAPCVSVNLAKSSVRYSDAIEKGREIEVLGDEELARAWMVNRLAHKLGYKPSCIKLETTYLAGRGKAGTSENSVRIDAILEQEDGTPFYFVEVKAPEKYERDKILIDRQLFSVAALHQSKTGKKPKFLVYYTVEEIGGTLRDRATVIDYEKYSTYDSWFQAGMPSVSDSLSEKYARPKKPPYVRKGARDLISEFSPSEVKTLATSLHNVLWGGGSTGDTEVFTSLVNIILAKIQDEYDTPDDESYRFQVFQHGDSVESPEAIYERLNGVYRVALAKQLGKQGDLAEQQIVNREKFPLAKLAFAVAQIEKYSFVDGKNSLNGRDLLGDFFEQIQRDGFKQSKGQFFTPVNVVRFMLYAVGLDDLAVEMVNNQQKLPMIIDPSCGSATFLIEAMKMVTSEIKGRQKGKLKRARQVQDTYESMFMPEHRSHRWAREFLYGIEHNFDLATAAKVNMILHGDGSTNIFHKDGLKPFSAYEHPPAAGSPNALAVRTPNDAYGKKDVNGQFHVIVSNPPFSVDLDDDTKKTLARSFLFGTKKNSENLFIERYWQLLKEGGRMAIVLPESVFDTTENKYIRLFIFQFFHVRAVVSLPQVAFAPYTSTKTSILFAQKKFEDEVARWRDLWAAQSSRYGKLSRRVENHFKVHLDGAPRSSLPSVKAANDASVRVDVAELLGEALTAEEKALPIPELLRRKRRALDLALEADTDAAEVFGRVNWNWVMREMLVQSQLEAENSGDPSLEQNTEMFLAEATHIGYKRSKRGEITQPNELFSLEVAPSSVDPGAVDANYAKVIKDVEQRGNAAKARRKLADSSDAPDEKATALALALETKLAELVLERARVEAVLNRCYDGAGALKAAHRDRTDPELRAVFELPAMSHLRSAEILLDPSQPATILDAIRARRMWK
ncbi:N-6 DNA methylase [Pseudorhodoferax sp. Leaf267]|uniref:restriction endonuclease subunit M n=1 Tax=Pseudorhodoferax sp. Leaf267 TaxID=1736316 RepID=UPI00138EFD10|nr:N-6 DNA methylase [Pseudorhodoferax sp. Leaf267]